MAGRKQGKRPPFDFLRGLAGFTWEMVKLFLRFFLEVFGPYILVAIPAVIYFSIDSESPRFFLPVLVVGLLAPALILLVVSVKDILLPKPKVKGVFWRNWAREGVLFWASPCSCCLRSAWS